VRRASCAMTFATRLCRPAADYRPCAEAIFTTASQKFSIARNRDEFVEIDRFRDVAIGVQVIGLDDCPARLPRWSGRRLGYCATGVLLQLGEDLPPVLPRQV